MFFLFILFVTIPILEIMVLLRVGALVGLGNTLLIILITGFLGAYLARSQGMRVLKEIEGATSQGKLPGKELLHGLCILLGGLVLLTPGFVTDLMGFFLLFPPTRSRAVSFLKEHFEGKVHRGEGAFFYSSFGGARPSSGPRPVSPTGEMPRSESSFQSKRAKREEKIVDAEWTDVD